MATIKNEGIWRSLDVIWEVGSSGCFTHQLKLIQRRMLEGLDKGQSSLSDFFLPFPVAFRREGPD